MRSGTCDVASSVSGGASDSAAVVNRLCPWGTIEQERVRREEAVAGQLGVFRALLPKLLKDLAKAKEMFELHRQLAYPDVDPELAFEDNAIWIGDEMVMLN